MKNYPELETTRLILRKPSASDIPNIVKHINNPKIADATLNIPYPYNTDHAIFWINMAHQGFANQDKYVFVIEDRETGEVIGGIGLHLTKRFNRAEFGYWLSESFWNKGLMSEALKRMIDFGFEDLKLNKLTAVHNTTNPASGKVMEKNRMVKEGVLKQHYKKGDTYQDVVQYGVLQSEWGKK